MTKPASINTGTSVVHSPALDVDVQLALADDGAQADIDEPPSSAQITAWANAAYLGRTLASGEADEPQPDAAAEVTIRLVSEPEIHQLNRDYRGKDKATNVLAFAFDMLDELDVASEMPVRLLGDVVICHSVIVQEAVQQNKDLHHHYAHIVTHGVLHLCGYDHLQEDEAQLMEALEANILALQGIDNPYDEL